MAPGRASHQLRLIGGFELRLHGDPIELPPSAQRVVAYVGLHDRPILRPRVAGTLWLETSDRQALANLRSVLWRLRRAGFKLIDAIGEQLSLVPDVAVDVRTLTRQARTVLGSGKVDLEGVTELEQAAELLPDWYDDWVLVERERFRQLRLHALERLCVELTRAGDFARAVEVGLVAVAEEPLRESAHRALIEVHLAEGNASEALRQYRSYERMMRDELGLEPSEQMDKLVQDIRPRGRGARGDALPVVTAR